MANCEVMYTSRAIREALAEEMRRDPTVFCIGEDIAGYGGAFKVTVGLAEEFGPERVVETPISENSVVGVGVGAALCGLRPVVEIMFMDFMTLAMDQLVNHAAKFHFMYAGETRVPLVVRTPSGGGKGYGATHSQTLDTWFTSVPGLKVVAPWSPADTKALLKTAIRDDNPVLFIENKQLYAKQGPVPLGEHLLPFGCANVLREGADVTVVAYSRMVDAALTAAEALAEVGVQAEVIDLRSLQPLDDALLCESVAKTGRVVLVEEGVRHGGVMAEVACRILEGAFDYLEAAPVRLGAGFAPIPCAEALERSLVPSAQDIADAVAHVLKGG
jgi:pyruvate/2-oxoglutarate/acetoin dehydrogenase E1 component